MAKTMTPLVTTCAVGRKPDRARGNRVEAHSPECVEGLFLEVRGLGVLRSRALLSPLRAANLGSDFRTDIGDSGGPI